jgi:hypothetical protein
MRDGRQCLWYIYAHFTLPGVESAGLKIAFAVIDLTSIKLIGGDGGLGNFWSRWCDCMARVTDNPAWSTCQHIFADEMRESKMMNVCVRDYDELARDRVERTWGHLGKKRRACFERARLRGNLSQTQHPERETAPAGCSRHGGTRCCICASRWTGPGPSDVSAATQRIC